MHEVTVDGVPHALRVDVRCDHDVVVDGLLALLAAWSDPDVVAAVAPRAGRPLADVTVVDGFGRAATDLRPVDRALHGGGAVVVHSWCIDSDVVAAAFRRGAAGYVSKHVRPPELVHAVRRVGRGETVAELAARRARVGRRPRTQRTWPGKEHGLTERQAEVLVHVAAGRSNREVGAALRLSTNSVKTHVRSVYRRIGVARRSQAVLWAVDHGMRPTGSRPPASATAAGRP